MLWILSTLLFSVHSERHSSYVSKISCRLWRTSSDFFKTSMIIYQYFLLKSHSKSYLRFLPEWLLTWTGCSYPTSKLFKKRIKMYQMPLTIAKWMLPLCNVMQFFRYSLSNGSCLILQYVAFMQLVLLFVIFCCASSNIHLLVSCQTQFVKLTMPFTLCNSFLLFLIVIIPFTGIGPCLSF